MVKRLGALQWRRLHQAIYVIGMLALIHFFQQTKADFTLPASITGLFGWLICYRLVAARVRGEPNCRRWRSFVLTLVVALLTFIVEAVGIGLWYRASPLNVLQTVFDFDLAIRPGWYVLAAGLGGRAGRCRAFAQAARLRAGAVARARPSAGLNSLPCRRNFVGAAPARIAPGQEPARARGGSARHEIEARSSPRMTAADAARASSSRRPTIRADPAPRRHNSEQVGRCRQWNPTRADSE